MTANDNKSYLDYLKNLVDQNNKIYHHFIGKKPIDAGYSGLAKEIKTNFKAPKFKVGNKVRITKYKNIFSKGYTKNWSRKMFVIDSILKTNPWTYKMEDLN